MEKYRIEDVRIVKVAGTNRKVFKAYDLKENAYVFCGEFTAPAKTAKKDLHKYIAE